MEWILFLVILIILLAIVFIGVSRKDKNTQKINHDTSSDHSSGWWAHSSSDTGDFAMIILGVVTAVGIVAVAAEIDICSEKRQPSTAFMI